MKRAFAAKVGLAFLLMPLLLPGQESKGEKTGLDPSQPSGEQIVERVSPSVVLILVGGGGGKLAGVGSGVIVREDGILLTAYHLVKNVREVQVRLKNGEIYDDVDLIGADERRDAAALRISARALPALPVAKVEDAKPGQTVYVVSNPGALAWSASSGVLSAHRLADEVPGAGTGYRLLQFTAPVSPGSSGGALVDAQGQALGIVIASKGGQNLNFAVPMESVLGLVEGSARLAFRPGERLRLRQTERPPAPPSAPAGSAQGEQAPPARSIKAIHIFSRPDNFSQESFPVEPLIKILLEQDEFRSSELTLVTEREGADLVIELSRKEMTWDFTYLMTHPATGTLVGSGKVIAWDGVRAAPGIAKQIIKRLRELRSGYSPDAKER